MSGTGRKRPPGRPREFDKRVPVMLSEAQLSLIEDAKRQYKEATGVTVTTSELVRSALEDGCTTLVKRADVVQEREARLGTKDVRALMTELQEIRSQVRRVGVNVNELTKLAHRTGRTPADLDGAREQLESMSAALVALERSAFGGGDDG